jgi:adsorption protein A
MLFLLALLPKNGVAAETPPVHMTDVEYYLKKVGAAAKKQGFLEEEVRKFRSYPHLDRAYRLQGGRRFIEARKEFEAYLTLAPDDIHSQISYLMLLDKMSLHDDVIAQADLILSRWPAFIPAYFYKGMAYTKLGNQDRALAVFSTAAAAKDILKADRIFALSTAADLAISQLNYEDAGRILQTLTEIEKKHTWYMRVGFVLEKSGRLHESLDFYSAAKDIAELPAEKVAASLAVAEVAKKLNNIERARQAYEIVIGIESSNQAAIRGLANIAYLGKRYSEAEKWMSILAKISSKPEDKEFLADLYLKRHNYADAIIELNASVDLQGKKAKVETLSALAQAYESAGRLKEGVLIYKMLLVRVPGSGDILLRYGNLLIRMKKFAEAGPYFKKALLSGLPDRQKSVAHKNLALVYEKSGNYVNAVEELENSMLTQPAPIGDLLVRCAVLLNRVGKAEKALQYLDRALAEPNLPDDLKLLSYKEKSTIFEKSGQTSRAASELERALKLTTKDNTETIVRLAVLLNKTGMVNEALNYLDLALAEPSLSMYLKRVAFREKGLLLEKSGHRHEALLEYEKAMSLGDSSPNMYLTVANLYQSSENPELAIGYLGYLNKVIQHPEATNNEKCSAEDSFGMYYFKHERVQEATDHFSAALHMCGENWLRRYYLGLVHYRSKRWEQALEQFLLAAGQKQDPATLLSIALSHKELNRPGAAVHYLQLALQEPGSATPEQLKQIDDTLGYLYMEEYAYDEAADAFTRSRELASDHIVSLNLSNVYYLSGKTDEAWKALNDVDSKGLSTSEIVVYNDLKSRLLQRLELYDDALALLEKTQKLQPTPSRSYELGLLCQKTGQLHKAIEHFQAASAKESQQTEYALALGYAYVADGRFSDAIGIFEVVAARNPESKKIREELGYFNIKICKNVQAAQWFEKALDSFPVTPRGNSEESDQWENDAHRIRGEITKLTKTFNLALYASYRAGKAPNSLLANGEQISGGLNGQIGIETSYRPPVIGLYNERILELFGRVFGNLNPNSLNYNTDSTQAGIGLRYKFLQNENLWISGERLIKVGKFALDDWLLRLLYSRGNGFEPLPLERNQDYYLLYGEVDGYVRSEIVAASAEVRKGRAFTLRSNYMLIPHLALDARWQSPFNAGGNYLEGGAGISLKYFFNNTQYKNFRNVLDFSITYKHGMFIDKGFHENVGNYDSALFSLGLFF